jgi:hypothetical protein
MIYLRPAFSWRCWFIGFCWPFPDVQVFMLYFGPLMIEVWPKGRVKDVSF